MFKVFWNRRGDDWKEGRTVYLIFYCIIYNIRKLNARNKQMNFCETWILDCVCLWLWVVLFLFSSLTTKNSMMIPLASSFHSVTHHRNFPSWGWIKILKYWNFQWKIPRYSKGKSKLQIRNLWFFEWRRLKLKPRQQFSLQVRALLWGFGFAIQTIYSSYILILTIIYNRGIKKIYHTVIVSFDDYCKEFDH